MKTISSQKTAFFDFEVIYNKFFGGNNTYSSEEVSTARENIRQAYGLENVELMIIALLTHTIYVNPKANGLLCKKVAEMLCLTEMSFLTEILDSLQTREFLCIKATKNAQEFICLTEAAISAFHMYHTFGIPEKIDFVEMLRFTSASEINAIDWILKFRKSLKTCIPSDFTRGWTELKADELSDREARCFCIALSNFINNFTTPAVFPDVCSKELDSLIQKGLLASTISNGIISNKNPSEEGYIISPKVAEVLFHGHDEIVKYDISKMVTLIKSEDIKKKELFFSSESQVEIDNLRKMLSPERFERFCAKQRLRGETPAIQSLFYGGPGTGKTETIKQLARETGRDIFLFNFAKVGSPYISETEINYRKLFLEYRYIVSLKSLTPILLLNEADQVLSCRLSELRSSADKGENAATTILLQEIEDMSGILLATTNDVDVLDKAFDRRFLFKTELNNPNSSARVCIWESKFPELPKSDIYYLAENYEMSGGQIANVAKKYDASEFYYDGDRGLMFIAKLCEEELRIVTRKQLARCGF